jgi:hypothetical protein
MGSKEMFPLKVRHNDLVPLRYLMDALGLCPVIHRCSAHVFAEVIYNSRYIWVGTVRAVQEFFDESWKRD